MVLGSLLVSLHSLFTQARQNSQTSLQLSTHSLILPAIVMMSEATLLAGLPIEIA